MQIIFCTIDRSCVRVCINSLDLLLQELYYYSRRRTSRLEIARSRTETFPEFRFRTVPISRQRRRSIVQSVKITQSYELHSYLRKKIQLDSGRYLIDFGHLTYSCTRTHASLTVSFAAATILYRSVRSTISNNDNNGFCLIHARM